MFEYGGTTKVKLTKDVLGCILNKLHEEHWYKLKYNLKIVTLMVALHKKLPHKELAKAGHIESLDGCNVESYDISQCRSLNVVKRFYHDANPNLNGCLYGACKSGCVEIAKWAIRKGATDWDTGLAGACQGGHMELAKLMISNGATNYNKCLGHACLNRHKDIVELMIVCGANQWNVGLREACGGGNNELINLMIMKGANNWNDGLRRACVCGQASLGG